MERKDGRGRPKKDPGKKRDEILPVMMTPSGKEIVRQEADRCGTTMSNIVEVYAQDAIEGGRNTPVPEIHEWMLERAVEMQSRAEEERQEWLVGDLEALTGEITTKKVEVSRKRKRREELREKRKEENLTDQLSYRVSKDLRKWYEERAERGVTSLVRWKALEGIFESGKMEATEKWLERWEREIERIISQYDDEADLRDRSKTVLQSLERKIRSESY